jgi:O-antigen/teichoic acid export membrane protein
MRFRNFNSLKSIGSMGLASIVGSSISAFFWIYIAAIMGAENYGELGYYISIAGLATSLSFIGGPMAITVLVAKKYNIESTVYFVSIFASIVSALVLYFAFTNIGMSVYVLGAVIYNLASSELLGRKFYKKYSIYLISQKILFVLFSLLFYYLIGPEGILIGIGLSFLIFTERIYRGFKDTPLNFQLLKTKWKFMSNNFLLDLSYILDRQTDKLIIGPLFGFIILGNYYLALQVLSMLAIIPAAVQKFTLSEDSSGSNTTKIKLLTILFSVFLALVGIVIAPKILLLLFPDYAESLELVPIISISIIPITISTLISSEFLAKEKSGFIVMTSVISIAILIIGIFSLGTYFGIVGLAYSLVISDSSRALILYIISLNEKRKIHS